MPLSRHSVGTYQETSSQATQKQKTKKTELTASVLKKRCARFVLFRLIKKRSFNLLCVFDLTGNSLGNTQPQSSQLAEPLWTESGLKTGISVRELSPL